MCEKLCEVHKQHKFTLQLCFWDVFKQWEDLATKPRRTANLAKFLASLLLSETLTLLVLKVTSKPS